jgi:hypothetical protein
MNTKNALYGALCGALVFAVLSWAAPKKAVSAAVLAAPPEGRFELVQLHPSSGVEWSGILDTETGCTWTYTTHTPPTDAEVKAAPEGPLRDLKSYYNMLGSVPVFEMAEYDPSTEPAMSRPGEPKPSSVLVALASTSMTEKSYCNQARQNALRAAAR